MTPDFQTKTFGKWILAGEHSVLRGCPALVFPLKSKNLHFQFFKGHEVLHLELSGPHGKEMELLFWGVLEKACELCRFDRTDLHGTIQIHSNVPVGAGMGASATLCVAISQFFHFLNLIESQRVYDFARELENLFHGESSGVDIAVALEGNGLFFKRNGERKVLEIQWQPKLYISYTGQRGVTSECVAQVKKIILEEPIKGLKIDEQMQSVVQNCLEILSTNHLDVDVANQLLAKQLNLGCHCFEQWGLNHGEPKRHMDWLIHQGAMAVKPTGSGGGGYVLSLWRNDPPQELLPVLIPGF